MTDPSAIILASASRTRQSILKNAGVLFESIPADIDERACEEEFIAQNKDSDINALAEHLSKTKAAEISKHHPNAYVIGADQILVFEGQALSKAQTKEEAKTRLGEMRGKDHALVSGLAIVKNNELIWSITEIASLKMRDFSDEFLSEYCENMAGDALFSSVGCYALEHKGSQLFETVKGDYFTILGLPLYPLLAQLRAHQLLMS